VNTFLECPLLEHGFPTIYLSRRSQPDAYHHWHQATRAAPAFWLLARAACQDVLHLRKP
jgi:hypothetical protein